MGVRKPQHPRYSNPANLVVVVSKFANEKRSSGVLTDVRMVHVCVCVCVCVCIAVDQKHSNTTKVETSTRVIFPMGVNVTECGYDCAMKEQSR